MKEDIQQMKEDIQQMRRINNRWLNNNLMMTEVNPSGASVLPEISDKLIYLS